MRHRSNKTAKLYRDNNSIRFEFLTDCRHTCVACGRGAFSVDEILRGKNRLRAFSVRACWLPACDTCNTGPLADPAAWPLAKKLAAKLLCDPQYFDLQKIREVNAPAGCSNPPVLVTADDVLEALRQLLIERGGA